MVEVKIQKLRDDIELPIFATSGSAGLDLRAAESLVLKKGQRTLVPTALKIALPEGYEAQIRPRSGLAIKHGIIMPNAPGTVDADYRGELKVILLNLGNEDFEINKGDRIAQMVINKIEIPTLELVDELPESERGEGGFGHTGVQ